MANKIGFLTENKQVICSFKDSKIETVDDPADQYSLKKYLLSDSFIELKLINVPIVEKNILPNVIKNTLKKYTSANLDSNNFDFIITDKENNQYSVLTFINLNSNIEKLEKKNLFSVYHLLHQLVDELDLNDDSQFLIKEGKTYFLYSFADKKFKKRVVYFNDDLQLLSKKEIYFLDLIDNEPIPGNFLNIDPQKLEKAAAALKKGIFKQKKKVSNLVFIVAAGILILLLAGTFEVKNWNRLKEIGILNQKKDQLNKKLKAERAKQKINDETYAKLMKIVNNKSYAMEFFYTLYQTGINNMQINQIYFDKQRFSLNGVCRSDSKLEDAFRKILYWQDVNFSFTKRSGSISFHIEGRFIYE